MQVTPWYTTNTYPLSNLAISTGTGSLELTLEKDAVPQISYCGDYETLADFYRKYKFRIFGNNKTTIGDTGHEIDRVIYSDPATIVFWKDGTKTVVKCQKGDTYNPETGLAMCIIKKVCGNKANYNNIFTKWLPKEGE